MKLSGIIDNIIYRNSENGYTVISLYTSGEHITVSGKFPIVGKGEQLELEGEFKVNRNYGEQFEASSVIVNRPSTPEMIEKYLSCGLIPGVREVTAKNIVRHFKEQTLDIIENSPKMLAGIKGISIKKANEIHQAYSDIKKMQQAVMFMQKYDISSSTAVKIYEKYKNHTEEVLTTNPYRLIEDIDGIGFKTADKIAAKLGVEQDSPIRIRAGLVYTLNEIAEKQGSTLALQEELVAGAKSVLELSDENDELIFSSITDLEISGVIKRINFNDEPAFAITKLYMQEKYIAQKLCSMAASDAVAKLGSDKEIEQYEKLNKISLHGNQKQAILAGTSESVVIITGGPGTGKTTIIKGILKIFKNEKLKCMLMAPTGRAAKRLEEQTGEQASTIHRALEANFRGDGRGFVRNENNPLEADAIIVDEVSMLDVFLMSSLLKALPFGARLILVGDKDQLPSVGAGNVLADLIASDTFKVVELTQIFRQSEDSMIVVNAHKINNSEMPDLSVKSSDFFYSSTSEPELVASEVVSMMAERIPKFFDDITPDDIEVITPMKAGLAGTNNLNELIQEKLNPSSADKNEFTLHKRIFREGDRVMQIVNNYDREWEKVESFGLASYGAGVFNGDMGKIDQIITDINEVYVLFDDGRRACYSVAELDEIVLSYAITIHKSQGSEFPIVIIPIMGGSPLLMNKNLLYTAVTRAKKAVVLIGKRSNIFYMVSNKASITRNTMLKTLIQNNNFNF